jgi:hypothetical protein
MSRRLKLLAASVVAISALTSVTASAAVGRNFLSRMFSSPQRQLGANAPKIKATTPEAILAEQIAEAIAALPGTPTQAQITAAINGVLATSTASPQVKQTALAVVQASVGPTSPIAQAAGASATTLAVNTGAPVVSTSSAAVQTVVNTAVKAEIVTTLAGVSSNLANAGTPSNSDYRTAT